MEALYWDDDLRAEHTPEEIYQMMLKIEVDPCPICGYKLHLGEKCPGQLKNRNLPENPTTWQIRHRDAWTKHVVESTDYSFLAERNKTPEMREVSRQVGLKTGSANMKKAHAKYDGKKWCEKCQDYTKHIIGIGCMTCWNRSDKMRKATIDRNYRSWKCPKYARRIADNLGVWLGKSIRMQLGDTSLVLDFNGEYVEESKYYKEQEERFLSINGEELEQKLIDEELFIKESVINNPDGSINIKATEQSLRRKGYKWIVYVKELSGKPFMLGKTGTKLAHRSRFAFDFEIGENGEDSYGGIGRCLARRMCPEIKEMDHNYILVRTFETQEEALEFLAYIHETYQLFGS